MKIWTIEAVMSSQSCNSWYGRMSFGLWKRYCSINKNKICNKKNCRLKVAK